MNIRDVEELFDDIFDEFLCELRDVDLSDRTKEYLEELFDKDEGRFLREVGMKLEELESD